VLENTETAETVSGMLLDKSEENEVLFNAAKPMYDVILQEQGNEVLGGLGVDFSFDLLKPAVTNWVEEKKMKFADAVNATTEKQLRNTLVEGIQDGENVESLRKRIQKVFDGTVRGTAHRSRMIARTEVIGTFNYASVESYVQSGVVEQKEWLTALDERVRASHKAANGQVVAVGQPFDVGGVALMYPGDTEHGTAAEVINCRCTVLPVLEKVTQV